MTNLLSIDWDFMFRNPLGDMTVDAHEAFLYDWGHRDSPFFAEAVWPTRAAAFPLAGKALPATTGEEVGFWDRFRLSPRARLYLADSHALAAHPRVTRGAKGGAFAGAEVWNYDAHHDAGYKPGQAKEAMEAGSFGCDDWLVLYAWMGATCRVRYPRWRAWAMTGEPKPGVAVDRKVDDGAEPLDALGRPVVFDRVFVCRSAAWSPPWLDPAFATFLAACPIPRHRQELLQDDLGDSWPVRSWGAQQERDMAQRVAWQTAIRNAPRGATPSEVLDLAQAALDADH